MAESLESRYPIVQRQKLIWCDMDAFQHINNKVYFRYFEDARIQHFEETGITAHMKETGLGPILASTHCNYGFPLTYPDEIQVATWVTDIAKKKFLMHYLVYSERHDRIVADGQGLIVYYDYKGGKSCPIPEKIVDNITAIQANCPLK